MMLPILQIEQKEIETLEIELKEKVASLAKLKKEFDEMQVLYLVIQVDGSSDCLVDYLLEEYFDRDAVRTYH